MSLQKQFTHQEIHDELFKNTMDLVLKDLYKEPEGFRKFPTVQQKEKTPLNAQNECQNYGGADNIDNTNNYTPRFLDELKVIYRKLLACSLIIFFLCIAALIFLTMQKFYKWRGIVFNSLCAAAALIGIICGTYYDRKHLSLNRKKCKLKLLLFYFMICMILCIVVFVVGIVYAILIPIRINTSPSQYQYIPNTAFNEQHETWTIVIIVFVFLLSLLFWLIFILFYIDIIARAVLKRGRIEWIIIKCTLADYVQYQQEVALEQVKKNNFWFKLYAFVISFRVKFKGVRRILRILTGIHCFYRYTHQHSHEHRKSKDSICESNDSSSHEEEQVIAALEEGKSNVVKTDFEMKTVTKNICIDIVMCPCRAFTKICIQNGLLLIIMRILLFLVIIYIFAPIAVLILMTSVFWAPMIFCHFDCDSRWKIGIGITMVTVTIGFWVWLWWWHICPYPYFEWWYGGAQAWHGWEGQCAFWNLSTCIVELIIQCMGHSDSHSHSHYH